VYLKNRNAGDKYKLGVVLNEVIKQN